MSDDKAPIKRKIVSQALILCGRGRISSLNDDREDVAIALDMLETSLDLVLRLKYFYDGEKESILTPVPEPDRKTSTGVPYLLPSDFISLRDVRIQNPPIRPELGNTTSTSHNSGLAYDLAWRLEGDFIIFTQIIENLAILYVGKNNIRNNSLFIDYAAHDLAFRIVQSIGNRELAQYVAAQYDLMERRVSALSYDDKNFGKGNPFFTQRFR